MRIEKMSKDINYYLGLPYAVVVRADQDGDFVARVEELPGCSAHGKTPAKALEALEEAKRLWITDCLENHDPVPEPAIEVGLPSGKWLQRVPRSLHRKLIQEAKREGVSLNQLVTSVLSEAVGAKETGQPHEYQSLL
jgi:antitoxin HicB